MIDPRIRASKGLTGILFIETLLFEWVDWMKRVM